MTLRRLQITWTLFFILLIASLSASKYGAYPVSWSEWWSWFEQRNTSFEIFLHLRVPRVLTAAIVGAIHGIAGAALQGLFRNPLADPGLIGVTSGAGLGIALWVVLGVGIGGLWGPFGAAFIGGLLVTALVWYLAQSQGQLKIVTLLLAGIALNSMAGAIIGLMIFLADDQQLRDLNFWFLGSLSGASWQTIALMLPLSLIGIAVIATTATQLNILSLGESEAYHLGINVHGLKIKLLIATAMAVGTAVAVSGGIGFIGLVVPHLIRLVGGADHRYVLAASALGGAGLLVIADLLSRTMVAPTEFPVGILTAILGTPFFLGLLWKQKRGIYASS